jgi:hypothetical protein
MRPRTVEGCSIGRNYRAAVSQAGKKRSTDLAGGAGNQNTHQC